jgi:hypothetical protein
MNQSEDFSLEDLAIPQSGTTLALAIIATPLVSKVTINLSGGSEETTLVTMNSRNHQTLVIGLTEERRMITSRKIIFEKC